MRSSCHAACGLIQHRNTANHRTRVHSCDKSNNRSITSKLLVSREVVAMPGLRLKLQAMTDKLKSKIPSRFLPKSTYTAPAATGSNMSGSNSFNPQASSSQPRGSNCAPSTPRGQPIIFNERSKRNSQTLESEDARNELLKNGITVRDFQVEADARKFGEMAGPEVMVTREDWRAFDRPVGPVDQRK